MAELITALKGGQHVLMDPAQLSKREGVLDNANERTTWVEYWDGDELVHRSVHVSLKSVPTPA
jgi:hypothetical protein